MFLLISLFDSGTRRPGPPIVDTVRVPGDADTFTLQHAGDGAGSAANLDSRAAEPLEGFDAGPVDEVDVRQIETHGAPGSKKPGAFVFQQGSPLGDDAPLEPQPRPNA
jgi:hypothetical protein